MRKNILMRLVWAVVGIILCVWGIVGAVPAGLSKLGSKYALVSRSLALADEAVRLSPSDAEAHSSRALVLRNNGDLEGALREFEKAVALRPRHYVLWYELALARDNTGDSEGAIAACEESVHLAPYYGRTHWLLGNLLYRAGRREEAFSELRRAASSSADLLPNIIDLAWGTYRGDARAVQNAVQPQTNASKIALAKYFAQKGRFEEAIALFHDAGGADDAYRSQLLRQLLDARRFKEAYEIWAASRQTGTGESKGRINQMTDPGFEGVIKLTETGFGWLQPSPVENVHISLDSNNAHTGARSLLIDFNGNSNPGSPVLSQLVLVEPSTRYDLRFAARTEKIVSGGLPQITISETGSPGSSTPPISQTLPADAGSWNDYSIVFTTGKETQAIVISLNRQNCTSSPCPAFGRVWLDDFSLQK